MIQYSPPPFPLSTRPGWRHLKIQIRTAHLPPNVLILRHDNPPTIEAAEIVVVGWRCSSNMAYAQFNTPRVQDKPLWFSVGLTIYERRRPKPQFREGDTAPENREKIVRGNSTVNFRSWPWPEQ